MRTTSQILKSIKAVCSTAAKLEATIHTLAVECLEHAQAHGDPSLMFALIKGLPTGQRVEALVLWVTAFSPIRFTKDEDGQRIAAKILGQNKKGYTPFNIEAATAVSYANFTKENEPKELTLEALMKLVKNMTSRYNKAEENGLVADGEGDAIKAYIASLQSVAVPTTATIQ